MEPFPVPVRLPAMADNTDSPSQGRDMTEKPNQKSGARESAGQTRGNGENASGDFDMEESGGEDLDWLAESLGAYYDDLLNEPVPDKIAGLLKKLEKKEIKD